MSTREFREELFKKTIPERNKIRTGFVDSLTENNKFGHPFYLDNSSNVPFLFGISNDYFKDVKRGVIEAVKTEVEAIEGKKVKLKNGKEYEIDEIILCTGYNLYFPFLDKEILNTLHYDPKNKRNPIELEGNYVFNSKLKNLAFVGFLPYDIGFSAFELQSKLAMKFFKNGENLKLKMKGEYDYRDTAGYMEFLAEEIGILPDLNLIRQEDQELFDYVLKGPFMVGHYQLRKENLGTAVWKKNAEFIKWFNKELKRDFNF